MQFLFLQCTKKCGKGGQARTVKCVHMSLKKIVTDKHCKQRKKPRTHQECNNQTCPYMWTTGTWSEVITKTYFTNLENSECTQLLKCSLLSFSYLHHLLDTDYFALNNALAFFMDLKCHFEPNKCKCSGLIRNFSLSIS